jgi:hypothetical protein
MFENWNLVMGDYLMICLPARPTYARRSGGFAQAGAASAKAGAWSLIIPNQAFTIFFLHCFIPLVTFRVSIIRDACFTTQA